MSGRRPFRELTKGFSAARKAASPTRRRRSKPRSRDESRKTRAVSQEALAAKLAVGQPAVAKLERRADMYVSNLRRYVEVLGGTLEITAHFPDGAVTIADVGGTDATEK